MVISMLSSSMNLITNHLTLSDVAAAMAILFTASAMVERLTTKGPMMWPVLGVVPALFFNIANVYDWATDSVRRAGGTFAFRGLMFGRCFGIITVDPANIEYMLKTRFTNFPKGKIYRERFAELLGDGIFNADGEVWKEQRRAATAKIHSSRFAEYAAETVRELVQSKLLKLLQKLATSGESVDLQDVFLRFTFDNICSAAFGVDPGCLAIDLPEIAFAKAFEQATEFTLFRFIVPPIVWKPMRLLNIGTEGQLKAAVGIVHEFAEKTVADRRAELRKLKSLDHRSDLLSQLLAIKEDDGAVADGKFRFSDKFLKDLCISFILAGRDTSSVALGWFFWLLHKHPAVERRILDEISAIISRRDTINNNHKSAGGIVFTVEELKRMNYLQAALSESLRLYPSVPLDFKEVVEDDVLPDGTAVKKGARVIYCIYSMGRMESIWGKDCMEFKPERWLRDGVLVSESPFKYPVFNAGPRLCIGKKFAYMQMKMVAASILVRYHVEVVVPEHEVVPKLTTTLYMKNGVTVSLNPRDRQVSF